MVELVNPISRDEMDAADPVPSVPWWQRHWARVKARASSAWMPRQVYLCGVANGVDDPMACSQAVRAFGDWCAQHEGSVCELGLSNHWLLTSLIAQAPSVDVAVENALSNWSHYFDLDTQDMHAGWVIRTTLLPESGLVCAVPMALIQGLRVQAEAHGVRLQSVRPWWVRGVQQCLDALANGEGDLVRPHLCLREPGLLTRMDAQRHRAGVSVSRMWTEAVDGESVIDDGNSIELLAAVRPGSAMADQARAWSNHVWDHAEVAQVLRGDAAVWRGRA